MKNLVKNIPLHAFLIIPALIFFLFVHNYPITSFRSTWRSYLIAFGMSFIIYGVLYFLLKRKKHKAGVVTTASMLILFFYGFIYDIAERLFYKGWWPFSEIHRYIIILILILITILCYFLFRTKRTFHSLTFALNSFVLVFFLLNFFQLIAEAKTTDLPNPDSLTSHTTIPKNDSLPDIYYIVLDGYANDSILATTYHYPKNSLTGFLKEKQFYLANKSKTNYVSTSPSLSSSLNFSYLDSISVPVAIKKNIIYKNKVSLYLKQKGYKIVHIRSGYSVSRENDDADTTIALNNMSEFERTLLRFTILRL
ncbi:MAG TPA: hypothetical protein VII99_05020, partial [Bacteroidia bacterium]